MYKGSDEGQKLLDLFNPEPEDIGFYLEKVFEYAHNVNKELPLEVSFGHFDHIFWNIHLLDANQYHISKDDITREDFEAFITELELMCLQLNEEEDALELSDDIYIRKDDYRAKASLMYAASLALYYYHSFFKPMLYPNRFDVFQRKCTAIGIDLPPIPRSNNYAEYLMYYYDICVAINQFQTDNGMTDAEVCACLYGCSELFVDDDEKASELPRPVNVWFTGASKEDYVELEKMENSEHIWACNERTRRGDIVTMFVIY